jgi:hypothetical protein
VLAAGSDGDSRAPDAAAPRHLALSHFYPPVEHVDIRALVGARYTGPVTLATDGWYFDLEDE